MIGRGGALLRLTMMATSITFLSACQQEVLCAYATPPPQRMHTCAHAAGRLCSRMALGTLHILLPPQWQAGSTTSLGRGMYKGHKGGSEVDVAWLISFGV